MKDSWLFWFWLGILVIMALVIFIIAFTAFESA